MADYVNKSSIPHPSIDIFMSTLNVMDFKTMFTKIYRWGIKLWLFSFSVCHLSNPLFVGMIFILYLLISFVCYRCSCSTMLFSGTLIF